MENEALLIIDYTNDFVDDKGALTCGAPAQALAGQIVSLADQFLAAGKWVILPTDKHFKGNPLPPGNQALPAPQPAKYLGPGVLRTPANLV